MALISALVVFGSIDTLSAQASGFAALTVSKPVYQLGEKLRLCYALPGPGSVTITETDEHGAKQVLLSSDDDDGNTDCLTATLGGDPGRVCEKLDYDTARGSGTLETCYQLTDSPAPAPAPTAESPALTISPEKGPPGTRFTVDGVGFQTFITNFNGISVIVSDRQSGLHLFDLTRMPPTLEGNLHLVLDTTGYVPGAYMLSTAYSSPAMQSTGVVFDTSEPVFFSIVP